MYMYIYKYNRICIAIERKWNTYYRTAWQSKPARNKHRHGDTSDQQN